MEEALYHPKWGYYNSKDFDIGKYGDFTTAPEISPLFAQCIAKQCRDIFEHLGTNHILELGAGTGRFAKDLLSYLDVLGCLPTAYYIYEKSSRLREKQKMFLQTYPCFYSRIIWLDKLPKSFLGTIIANEVLDALPVHCFRINDRAIKERCVTWEKDAFIWQVRQSSSLELIDKVTLIRQIYSLHPGYESEINLNLHSFLQSITNMLEQGIILLIDYGYGRREYYHPERSHGTLTCFYQHRYHNNPLIFPGQQDITAHVDFTHVIEIAVENNCNLLGYATQASFLLDCGLLTLAKETEKHLSSIELINLHQAIKLLTLPTEMGERIKVMALGKKTTLALLGFQLQDRRQEL
ncbi:MAG TPA: SAM-dependent methyltransferase [Gammaproteobacteria bacterium]|nr:SAM-dependent methyltransferase [Gammaproteobacteria bacterium]